MKLFPIFVFLLLLGSCGIRERHEQIQRQILNQEKCLIGTMRYVQDSISDSIHYYIPGPAGYGNTYPRLMLERYGLHIVMTDLFGLYPDMLCYNDRSLAYIKERFGDEILYDTRREAQRMDREGLGDSPPHYGELWDSVSHFFHQRIDPKLYALYYQSNGHFEGYGYFFLDSTGKITDVAFSSVRGSALEAAIQSIAADVPTRANPARDDGRPAAGSLFKRLVFNAQSEAAYAAFNGSD